MKFSRICHNCSCSSNSDQEFCPECGFAKHQNIVDSTIYTDVVYYFAKKIPNIENSEMLVGYIINLLMLLIGILLLNPLFESSELLWIFFIIYSIQGIIKGISLRQLGFNKYHLFSRGIIAMYIGSGIGNLISYTGKNHDYYLSNFFYPNILLKEISSGNGLVIVGALSGIIIMMTSMYLLKILKQ